MKRYLTMFLFGAIAGALIKDSLIFAFAGGVIGIICTYLCGKINK